ncbi:MAG TPA: hypothetical protein VHE12_06075 [bacterium]|nr:hypothetical protein [bacterium]
MTSWEKNIEKHLGRQGYRIKWVRTKHGTVFLLAWKGKEVQIIYSDSGDELPLASAERVKEHYIGLLVHLVPDPGWEDVFKGREVFFKWATARSSLDAGSRTLEQAGVERFYFPDLGDREAPAVEEEGTK